MSHLKGFLPLDDFAAMRIIESVHMTVRRAHPLASERTLARVFGGAWWAKTIEIPSPKLVQAGAMIVGHPATVARLRAKLKGEGL